MLGTVGYMSPEQVRGQPVDHRTDIFSFGAILYEMLCGRRAFSGATSADTITSILREDPPELLEIAPTVSPALDRVVRHCLEKSPERRFQSARDLAFDLEAHTLSGSSGSGFAAAPEEEGRRIRTGLIAGVAAVALVAGLTGAWIGSRLGGPGSSPASANSVSFRQITYGAGIEMFPAVSPDGRSIVYAAEGPGGDLDLFLQRVGGRAAINLTPRSDGDDMQAAFSPDGSQIAFRSERSGGGIFVMGATGESVRRISDFGFNPAWSPDGSRLVVAKETTIINPESRNTLSSLWILDIRTGERRLLLERDGMQPSWSPNGERIAYWGILGDSGQRDLWTISATAENPASTIVPVTNDAELDWNPVWSVDGSRLYFGSDRNGTRNLWRIAIDQSTGEVRGAPEALPVPGRFAGHFDIATSAGSIVFTLLDRSAAVHRFPLDRETGEVGEPELVFGGSLLSHMWSVSPDGEWLALSILGETQDILLVRADGTEVRQLTDDGALDRGPSFSRDGSEIYFYTTRNDTNYDIWKIGIDGAGITRVTETEGRSHWYPIVSPDGTRLATFNEQGTSVTNLSGGLPVSDIRTLPAFPDEQLRFMATSWSPDGRQLSGDLWRHETGTPGQGIALYSFEDQSYRILSAEVGRSFEDQSYQAQNAEGLGAFFIDTGEVFARDRRGPFLMDPVTGRRTSIKLETEGTIQPSSDGRFIYAESRATEGDIWMLEEKSIAAEGED